MMRDTYVKTLKSDNSDRFSKRLLFDEKAANLGMNRIAFERVERSMFSRFRNWGDENISQNQGRREGWYRHSGSTICKIKKHFLQFMNHSFRMNEVKFLGTFSLFENERRGGRI